MATFSQDVKAEPNLTPILDMVFQLITFFMVVISFKSADMDLNLQLPVVGSARPVEGATDLFVLNIESTGDVKMLGRISTDIAADIVKKRVQSQLSARLTSADIEGGAELPTTVVIRADRATPFKMLNRVIKLCQDNGFRQFALKAMEKPPDKPR
jgi:biopolymer transport protein ExbD